MDEHAALPDWDEATRPAPPAYDDASPRERASGEHLRAIHDMYRRGLAQVGEVVDLVEAGRAGVGEARGALHGLGLSETYQLLGSYCGQVCRAVRSHHGIEDAHLYPPLRASGDQALRPALDRLAHEHEVVHDVLERLDATLVAAAHDHALVERLGAEFRHLRRLLESHFTYEEQAIGTALGVHGVGI